MKPYRSFFLALACVLVFTEQLTGQPTLPAIPSPTAANLGLYGETPVSYFTGIPNIQIPLYELKAKQLSVPLSLNYHPAGIRPMLHPGPTGLGWSLQAGGVITRTVKGWPDEFKSVDTKEINKDVRGYYYHTNELMATNWKTFFSDKNCDQIFSFLQVFKDLEPDEFSFSFMGISGKFYFDQSGEIKVQSDRPVKVEFTADDFKDPEDFGFNWSAYHTKTFAKFTITDEWGNKYIFGNNAIEFSCNILDGSLNQNRGDSYSLWATSWFLTSVIPADGSGNVDFQYERGPIIAQLFNHDEYYLRMRYTAGGDAGDLAYTQKFNYKTGHFIYPVYLKEISYHDASIRLFYSKSNELKYWPRDFKDFCDPNDPYTMSSLGDGADTDYFLFPALYGYQLDYYNSQDYGRIYSAYRKLEWWKLDSIAISHAGDLLKKINFHYKDTVDSRLFLENLSVSGNTSKDDNKLHYSFAYKNRELLTRYDLTLVDEWGFYKMSGVPDPGAYYQSGVLETITYPTGGTSTFKYEANTADKVVDAKNRSLLHTYSNSALNPNNRVGGFRIKEIVSDDRMGNVHRKKYYYNAGYLTNNDSLSSSGVLNVKPETSVSKNFLPFKCHHNGIPTISYVERRNTPFVPLTHCNGGEYIGYTTVTEVLMTATGIEGYKQYVFTNHDNGYKDDSPMNPWNNDYFWEVAHSSRHFERGRLLKEMAFSREKDTVLKKEYTWDIVVGDASENNNPRALQFDHHIGDLGLSIYYSNAYLNYIYTFAMTQERETLYNTVGNPVIKTIDYAYNNWGLLSERIFTNSDDSIYRTKYKYPGDFSPQAPYEAMVSKNIVAPVVEKGEYKNTDTFLSKERTNYSQQVYHFYAPASFQVQNRIGALETRATYTYDSKGNIRQVTKDNAEHTVYLWGYQHQYPVARIEGASYSQVKSVLGQSLIDQLAGDSDPDIAELDNALRSGLQESMVLINTYSYIPLVGISIHRGPNGLPIYYEYDSLGRLKTVRDHLDNVLQHYEYQYAMQD